LRAPRGVENRVLYSEKVEAYLRARFLMLWSILNRSRVPVLFYRRRSNIGSCNRVEREFQRARETRLRRITVKQGLAFGHPSCAMIVSIKFSLLNYNRHPSHAHSRRYHHCRPFSRREPPSVECPCAGSVQSRRTARFDDRSSAYSTSFQINIESIQTVTVKVSRPTGRIARPRP
jgi:hypothetical protein